MNTSYRIGVDIGGTKVNAGILRPDGSILKKCLLSSGGAGNPRAFVDEICSSLRAMLDELNVPLSHVEHIGVGIPGTADSARGVVEYSCNLFGRNVPLGDYFEHALGRRVVVVQDSWAGAFAEHLFGAGRGHDDMMCVTIGTGIGCGVVLGGRVFGGAMHTGGELGHPHHLAGQALQLRPQRLPGSLHQRQRHLVAGHRALSRKAPGTATACGNHF